MDVMDKLVQEMENAWDKFEIIREEMSASSLNLELAERMIDRLGGDEFGEIMDAIAEDWEIDIED